jgi:tetratricopeptide (TPR) repeat protein
MKKSGKRKFQYAVLLTILISGILLFAGCNDESVRVMFDKYEQEGGKIENLRTFAVLDFGGKNPGIGSDIADELADKLEYMGYMQVMDRDETLNLLHSKGLPLSGPITQEDARQITAALGVDALIYGNIDANFYSTIRYRAQHTYPTHYYRRSKTGRVRVPIVYRPTTYIPYLNRSGNVYMKVHFYDALVNREAGAIEFRKNYNRDYNTYYTSSSFVDHFFFDRQYRTAMPSDETMLTMMADRAVDSFIDGFTPYYISKTRTIQDGIPGADKAKAGRWKEAREDWEKYIQYSPHNWQVNVNLGIYHERMGNPVRALTYYKAALADNPNDPELQRYVEETQRASDIRRAMLPVTIDENTPRYRVSEIKEDGRVFVNAGVENDVQPGDIFSILRERLELDKNLSSPTRTVYYPEAELVIEKVFEGVSWGYTATVAPGKRPAEGDIVIKR